MTSSGFVMDAYGWATDIAVDMAVSYKLMQAA
jgi:hypothetical protein